MELLDDPWVAEKLAEMADWLMAQGEKSRLEAEAQWEATLRALRGPARPVASPIEDWLLLKRKGQILTLKAAYEALHQGLTRIVNDNERQWVGDWIAITMAQRTLSQQSRRINAPHKGVQRRAR